MPIFDQGYQHWQGHVAGHGWRWAAVARHGIRIGMKNMFVRIIILLAWIPALGLAAAVCLWGMVEQKSPWAMSFLRGNAAFQSLAADPSAFRTTVWVLCFHVFMVVEIYYIMLLILVVGPSLISLDLRFNALPLYFSRPCRRIDYFLGKLGIIGFFLAMVAVGPAVAAWVLGVLFSLNFHVAIDTFPVLMAVVLYGFVVVVSAGLLMLALSSLSRNSRYVALFWAGLWLVGSIVSVSLEGIHMAQYYSRFPSGGYFYEQQLERDREEAREEANNPHGFAPAELARRAEVRRQHAIARENYQNELEKAEQLNVAYEYERRHDWRQVISYVQNLLRIGDGLLGYYEANDRYKALEAAYMDSNQRAPGFGHRGMRPPPELRNLDARWPWYWSGAILLTLCGLSVWILNTRVKSLDRLR